MRLRIATSGQRRPRDDRGGTARGGICAGEVECAAPAGTTYAMTVAGFTYWTANSHLSINAPGPANDDSANANPSAGVSGSVSATSTRATGEPGGPAHWGGGPYHSLW